MPFMYRPVSYTHLDVYKRQGLGYLDVNVLFDDENGCLKADYSADGAHILGSY